MAKNREITQFASLVSVHDSNRNITIVSAGDTANVGIGTDPEYKLDVGGDLNISGVLYQNGAEFKPTVFIAGEVGLGVTSSIGIGTTSSQGFQLNVLGSTNLNGPLNVTGVSTFGEQLDINDDVDISGNLRVAGITTLASLGGITTTGGDLFVGGNAKIIGILTVGSSSLTLDGDNDVVNVGTALTLGHTQGIQFYTQSLHSEGFEVNNINASGIVTANQFVGDGSNLTGIGVSLTATSGTERLVTTNIFSGIMTAGGSDADLTFNATTNTLRTYNLTVDNDLDVQGTLSANGSQVVSSKWSDGTGTSIYRVSSVGIGTTNALAAADSSNTTILSAGIVTAVRYYGDGSQLTGITGGGGGGGGGGEIFIQEEGTQVGGAVTTINIVGPRITATSSVGVATISVDVDEFPTGDYGDLNSATTDAFGIALSYAFDCLTQPQYLVATYDLQVLT